MAEKQQIRLSITGIQYPPREEQAHMSSEERERNAVITRMQATAEFCRRGDNCYFFYEEQPEGIPEVLKTRIKCRDGFMEMSRQGSFGSRMVFDPGKRCRTEYPTPFGKLFLDVAALNVVVTAEPEDGCPRVCVDYVLENEGREMGLYRLEIEEAEN